MPVSNDTDQCDLVTLLTGILVYNNRSQFEQHNALPIFCLIPNYTDKAH